MKKIFFPGLLLILLLASCVTGRQQVTGQAKVPKYLLFKEFKGDTAAFIKQNFEARKQYYIGKKLKVLLDDMELPVKFCSLSTNYLKYNGKGVDGGGVFYFCDESVLLDNLKTHDPKNTYGCDVDFAPPYVDDETITALLRKHGGAIWNKDSRKVLEQAIVTDVKFSNWRNSMGVMKQ